MKFPRSPPASLLSPFSSRPPFSRSPVPPFSRSPPAFRLSPFASRLPPFASRLSPLASRLSPPENNGALFVLSDLICPLFAANKPFSAPITPKTSSGITENPQPRIYRTNLLFPIKRALTA